MTKADTKYVTVGVLAGVGLFFGAWWFRRTREIPVINPVNVKWEL